MFKKLPEYRIAYSIPKFVVGSQKIDLNNNYVQSIFLITYCFFLAT